MDNSQIGFTEFQVDAAAGKMERHPQGNFHHLVLPKEYETIPDTSDISHLRADILRAVADSGETFTEIRTIRDKVANSPAVHVSIPRLVDYQGVMYFDSALMYHLSILVLADFLLFDSHIGCSLSSRGDALLKGYSADRQHLLAKIETDHVYQTNRNNFEKRSVLSRIGEWLRKAHSLPTHNLTAPVLPAKRLAFKSTPSYGGIMPTICINKQFVDAYVLLPHELVSATDSERRAFFTAVLRRRVLLEFRAVSCQLGGHPKNYRLVDGQESNFSFNECVQDTGTRYESRWLAPVDNFTVGLVGCDWSAFVERL